VAESYIAPKEIRENRSLLRLRTNLDKYDVKCNYDIIFWVKGTRWLKNLKLSVTIRFYHVNTSCR
jgi:hypothetical protein